MCFQVPNFCLHWARSNKVFLVEDIIVSLSSVSVHKLPRKNLPVALLCKVGVMLIIVNKHHIAMNLAMLLYYYLLIVVVILMLCCY